MTPVFDQFDPEESATPWVAVELPKLVAMSRRLARAIGNSDARPFECWGEVGKVQSEIDGLVRGDPDEEIQKREQAL